MASENDSLDEFHERLQEVNRRLADAAQGAFAQQQGPQVPEWPGAQPLRNDPVPSWPEPPQGFSAPQLPEWPGAQPQHNEPVPDWPEQQSGASNPAAPNWPEIPEASQSPRDLAAVAPELRQGTPDGPVRVEGFEEMVGLLRSILGALQGQGAGNWQVSQSLGGGQRGFSLGADLRRNDVSSLEGFGERAGLGQGYAAASPSVRYSSRAGARGAGGYGYGSSHSPDDLGPGDFAEPERHWR